MGGALINLIDEGDSITFGYMLTNNSDRYSEKLVKPNLISRKVTAVNGSTLSDINARIPVIQAGYSNIMTLLIGANDLPATTPALFVAGLKSYCLARRGEGWKVVLLTMLPGGLPSRLADYNTNRSAVNSLIRADSSFYDVLADVALDTTIGLDGQDQNLTYYSDALHPTSAAQPFIATIVNAALASLP